MKRLPNISGNPQTEALFWKNEKNKAFCVFEWEEKPVIEINIGEDAEITNLISGEKYVTQEGKATINISRDRLNLFKIL